MELLLTASYLPFTAALTGVALMLALELLGLLFAGIGPTHICEAMGHTHDLSDSPISDWLSIKNVPITIVLTLLLAGFGLTGCLVQAVTGASLPLPAVLGASVLGAGLLVRAAGKQVAKLFVLQTTAVSEQSLVGRLAVLMSPVAKRGYAGEVKLTDEHGHTHHVMVEPEVDDEQFVEGQRVMLVKCLSNHLYLACPVEI